MTKSDAKDNNSKSSFKEKFGTIVPESSTKYSEKSRGGGSSGLELIKKNQELPVLIEVSKKGYVPSGAKLITRISPVLFTARVMGQETLRCIVNDILVVRVEIGEKLDQAK